MADLFAPFAEALADREAAARAFKAGGGKVIGYFGNTAPVEIIEALGAYPLRLVALADETPLGDVYMEPLFDPVIRGVFERLLAGDYGFLDAVILPRTSDSVQRLYYYLCEIRRMGDAVLPEPLIYDLLHTPWYSSAEYNLARTGELKAQLERICGTTADDAALAAAIAAGNARRAALEAFASLRRATPPKVSGLEARQVFAASQAMPAEDFSTALAAATAGASGAHRGPRVVLAGSGQPTPALHALVEAAGAVVVGDFHEFGEPMIGGAVDTAAKPLRAITAHYHRDVASSRTFPQSPKPLADFAQACAADAVIFYFLYEEEALTWEYPAQRRALQSAGVATLCFENMTTQPDAATLAEPIKGFIAGLGVGVMP